MNRTTTTNDATTIDFTTWRRGRVWWTSDLHLGHERIIELCDRPFSGVGEMNRVLIEQINDRVTGHSTLVIVGDLALGKLAETLKLLKQIRAKRIWVIPGNHDRFSLAYRQSGSVEVVRNKRTLWRTEYERHHQGLRAEPDRQPSGWHVIIGGRKVLVSHYPYVGDSREDAERFGHLRPRDEGLPLIHGHVHGRWRVGPGGRMLNVGVDVNGYAPVSEDEVAGWLDGVPYGGVGVGVGGGAGIRAGAGAQQNAR